MTMQAKASGLRFSLRHLFILIFMLALGLALILPAFSAAQQAARRMLMKNNAKNLVLAMHNYHDSYSSLPRAYSVTVGNEPALSWRFTLLTWIDQFGPEVDEETGKINKHPYHHVNQNLAWNDPANIKACQFTFPIFVRLGAANRVPHATNFVVVRGPGTPFPDEGVVSFDDITDGLANTILLVEIDNSDIPWYEPRDLHIEQMSYRINDSRQPSIGNRRSKGAIVAMADGSVRFLSEETPPETLRAMLTIAGGETVEALPGTEGISRRR